MNTPRLQSPEQQARANDARINRYYNSLFELVHKGHFRRDHDLRIRFGLAYQTAWRAGKRPDLRTGQPIRLNPVREDRRRNRDFTADPFHDGRNAVFLLALMIVAVAIGHTAADFFGWCHA